MGDHEGHDEPLSSEGLLRQAREQREEERRERWVIGLVVSIPILFLVFLIGTCGFG